jgi:hypothetical protein
MGGFILASVKDLIAKDIDVIIAPGTAAKARLGKYKKSHYHEGWKIFQDDDIPIDVWERDKMETSPQTWSDATAAPMLNIQCTLIEINYHSKTNKFIVPHIYDAGFMHAIYHGIIELTPRGEQCKRWKYNMDKALRKATQLNFSIGPDLTRAVLSVVMVANAVENMTEEEMAEYEEQLAMEELERELELDDMI